MTPFRRFALLTAVCLAVPSARAAEIEPLLPKETEQVMFVNFKQIIGSDIVSKYAVPKAKEALKKDAVAEITEALGLDPLKDIDSVTAGIWGGGPPPAPPKPEPGKEPAPEPKQPPRPQGTPPDVFAIVRGNFDLEKLFKAAETYSNKYPETVGFAEEGDYKFVKAGDKNKPLFIFPADEKTILACTDAKKLADAIVARKAKAKAALSPKMMALVLKMDAKASMYFCQLLEDKIKLPEELTLPTVKDVDLGDLLNAKQLREHLMQVSSMCVTLRVGKEIGIEVTAGMKDADAAEAFGVTVGKFLEFLRTVLFPLGKLRDPKSTTLFDEASKTLGHKVTKADITILVKLSMEAIGQLVGDE